MKAKYVSGSPDAVAKLGAVPEWDSYPVLTEFGLNEMITRRQQLKEQADAIADELSGLNGEIATALMVADAKSVKCDRWLVTKVETRGPSRIIKEKLLELGVEADTIVAATEEGKPYTKVQVTKLPEAR